MFFKIYYTFVKLKYEVYNGSSCISQHSKSPCKIMILLCYLSLECYQIAKDDDLALFYKRILSNVVIKQRIFTTEKIILGLVDFDKSFPALVGSNCCCVLTSEFA